VEFLNIFENMPGWVAGQGVMFWTATGAVALGITLILSAGYIQFKRIRSKPVLTFTPDLAEKPEPLELPAEVPLEAQLNNDYQKAPVLLGTATGKADSREICLLLARLRKAADRLDGHQRSCGQHPVESVESPLKESREGVDYLFRTGTG